MVFIMGQYKMKQSPRKEAKNCTLNISVITDIVCCTTLSILNSKLLVLRSDMQLLFLTNPVYKHKICKGIDF